MSKLFDLKSSINILYLDQQALYIFLISLTLKVIMRICSLEYRSGQRCGSHFEGVAVWIRLRGCRLTLAERTVAELIRLMNLGEGRGVNDAFEGEERAGID